MEIKQEKVVLLSTVILVISPILNIYKAGTIPLSMAEISYVVLSVVFIFYSLIHKSLKVSKPGKYYSLFLFFSFAISIIMATVLINTITLDFIIKWAQMLVYSIPIIFFSSNFFNRKFGEKLYISISFFLSLFLILQFISFQVLHVQIKGLLSNLPLNYNLSSASEYYSYLNFHNIYRPSSIFIEPAHFSQYVSLALLMELFPLNRKKDQLNSTYYRAIVITFALMLSGSAIGFFSVLLFWGYWFWKYFIKQGKFIKSYFMSILLIFLGIVMVVRTNVFDKFLYRISTIGDTTSSTGSLRILRGYYIFSLGNPINKIFGIGFGNIINYLIKNGITTPYDGNLLIGNEYMNSLSYILVASGILGFILFLVFLLQSFVYIDSNSKLILLYLIVLLSTSAILLSPTYVVISVFLLSKTNSYRYSNEFSEV